MLTDLGLKIIKNRYFNELLGEIRHLSACEINSTKKPRFCSCGLLYDLKYYFIFSDLVEIIYPEYQENVYLQETQKEPRPNENKKVKKMLEELSVPICESKNYEECRRLITNIFGNKFSSALTRLKKRSNSNV